MTSTTESALGKRLSVSSDEEELVNKRRKRNPFPESDAVGVVLHATPSREESSQPESAGTKHRAAVSRRLGPSADDIKHKASPKRPVADIPLHEAITKFRQMPAYFSRFDVNQIRVLASEKTDYNGKPYLNIPDPNGTSDRSRWTFLSPPGCLGMFSHTGLHGHWASDFPPNKRTYKAEQLSKAKVNFILTLATPSGEENKEMRQFFDWLNQLTQKAHDYVWCHHQDHFDMYKEGNSQLTKSLKLLKHQDTFTKAEREEAVKDSYFSSVVASPVKLKEGEDESMMRVNMNSALFQRLDADSPRIKSNIGREDPDIGQLECPEPSMMEDAKTKKMVPVPAFSYTYPDVFDARDGMRQMSPHEAASVLKPGCLVSMMITPKVYCMANRSGRYVSSISLEPNAVCYLGKGIEGLGMGLTLEKKRSAFPTF